MNFDSANQHCLDRIVQLSEHQTVTAAQDIFDDRGMKLWAKGEPVSRELQAKLLRRKLARPLESTLIVEHALSFAEIMDDCLAHVATRPLLQRLAGMRAARELLSEAKVMQLPPPLRLLLTTVKHGDGATYAHTLEVVAICAGIACSLKGQVNDGHTLLMAAVLHDLGEIYVNPEYLTSKRRLAPEEWKHVVSHPRIGQVLIQELTTLPAGVAACVGQHHERHDGSGYPYQQTRDEQHRLSGWIAVADAAAALLASTAQGAGDRVALALRIVPGEFDRDAAGVVIRALRHADEGHADEGGSDSLRRARDALVKIGNVRRVLNDTAATGSLPFVRQTCLAADAHLQAIATAMRATGVLDAELLGEGANDPELLAEMHLVVGEVEWRMRNLARNLYLRAESQPGPEALAALDPIIGMIDG